MGRRFPLYLQRDSMKCGIACLQMVCDFHGRKISEIN
jgi:ATP-binding cassette subfamily B protein